MRLSDLLEAQNNEINWEKEILDDVRVANTGEIHPNFIGIDVPKAANDARISYRGKAQQNKATAINMALNKQGFDTYGGNSQSTAPKSAPVSKQPSATEPKPTRDRVRPTITTPDADRTRKDSLGRNLKSDRYYNQLNKSQRGRNIIKQVSQKLGLPPQAGEVIDHIADTMPTVIQKLDTILTNPADIGGRLNPRNRRK
jgi:hypothetical protein